MNVEISGESIYKIWGDLPTPCLIIDSQDGEIRFATRNVDSPLQIYTVCLSKNLPDFGKCINYSANGEISSSWSLLPNNKEIKISNS